MSATLSTCVRCFFSLLGVGGERETRLLLGTALKAEGKPDRSWDCRLQSFERLAQLVEEGQRGGVLLFLGADLDYA